MNSIGKVERVAGIDQREPQRSRHLGATLRFDPSHPAVPRVLAPRPILDDKHFFPPDAITLYALDCMFDGVLEWIGCTRDRTKGNWVTYFAQELAIV